MGTDVDRQPGMRPIVHFVDGPAQSETAQQAAFPGKHTVLATPLTPRIRFRGCCGSGSRPPNPHCSIAGACSLATPSRACLTVLRTGSTTSSPSLNRLDPAGYRPFPRGSAGQMSSPDHGIRVAAFEWLRRQVELHGDVLPHALLARGF